MNFGGKDFQALIDKVSNVEYLPDGSSSEQAYQNYRSNRKADLDDLMARANAINVGGGERFDYNAFMDDARKDDEYYASLPSKLEEKRLTSDYFNKYLQNYFNNPIFKFESKTTSA
jgi:hypothetical protein